jgi:hypothetical protein
MELPSQTSCVSDQSYRNMFKIPLISYDKAQFSQLQCYTILQQFIINNQDPEWNSSHTQLSAIHKSSHTYVCSPPDTIPHNEIPETEYKNVSYFRMAHAGLNSDHVRF